MIAGLALQNAQRSGGLRRERDAPPIEAMPNDRHAVARGAAGRGQQIGCVDHKVLEDQRIVVGMLERVEGVAGQLERGRVAVRKLHHGNSRSAFECGQHLGEPAVGGTGDEHLRAGEEDLAVGAGEGGAHRMQIAARLRFGGAEDR